MSMISEQINKLREAVKSYRPYVPYYVIGLLHNAADTIESLSAKLKEADCGGGWIPCKERLPDKKGDYWITYTYESYKHLRKCVGVSAFIDGKFTKCGINIIAWKPCDTPEPYHEP